MAGLHISDLAEAMVPFEVNSIAVDAGGQLTRFDPRERPFGFHFDCLGLRFAAVARHRGEQTWLQVTTKAGPLPYTAESPERRRHALAILRASGGLPHGRVAISQDRQIEISGEIPLAPRLTAVHVISAATELMLELRPYIGLLNDFVLSAVRSTGQSAEASS